METLETSPISGKAQDSGMVIFLITVKVYSKIFCTNIPKYIKLLLILVPSPSALQTLTRRPVIGSSALT